MSIIRTSHGNNKYGLVNSDNHLTSKYEAQKDRSGLVLFVGLLVVVAIVIFIAINWNTESLLLSFVLAYRCRYTDKWCIIRNVKSAKLHIGNTLEYDDGKRHTVRDVVEIEIAE